jgi:hypothetical protein
MLQVRPIFSSSALALAIAIAIISAGCSKDPHAEAMKVYAETLRAHPNDDAFAHPDFDKAMKMLLATPKSPADKKARAMKLVETIKEARASAGRLSDMKAAEEARQAMVNKNTQDVLGRAGTVPQSKDGSVVTMQSATDPTPAGDGPNENGQNAQDGPKNQKGEKDGKKAPPPVLDEPTTGPGINEVMTLYERVRKSQGDEEVLFELSVPSKRDAEKRAAFARLSPEQKASARSVMHAMVATIPDTLGSTVVRYKEQGERAMLILRKQSGNRVDFGVLRAGREGNNWRYFSLKVLSKEINKEHINAVSIEALKDPYCDFASGWD